jgi:Tfp pilus assembly protein PilF
VRPPRKSSAKQNGDTLAVFSLLLLAAIPYLNGLSNSFVYDDRLQVLGNPYAHSFRYLGKIFGSTVWTFEGAQGVTNYYRPLMTFAYLVGYKLFGPIPFGLHLVSLAIHMAVVLLLFAVADRLFGDRLLSLIAAGLFALHPIHTESVAWIAAITDLELSFFFLLTFLLYLRLGQKEPQRADSWWRRSAILLSYLGALLSKEQALMLPLLAIAYEHFYRPGRENTTPRTKIARYAPLCAMAAAYVAFRVFVLGGFAPSVSRPDFPWYAVFLSALALTGGYLQKLIWPLHLSAFYVFHPSRHWSDPGVLAGLLGLLLCATAFAWLWRHAHMVSFCFVWFAVTLAPVMNARWMPAGVFAERYLYLPSVGFCWLVAWVSIRVWRGTPESNVATQNNLVYLLRSAVPAALIAIAVFYAVLTVRRDRDWRTEETLYQRTLDEQPDSQLIRTNLGVIYFDRGDDIAAEREWLASMGPAKPYVSTLNNLGLLRTKQKRYAEAVDYFQRAIADRPLFSSAHVNLASAYAEMGRSADADREFRVAVSLAPLSSEARNAYGHFLLDQNREAEAREQFQLSVDADPTGDAQENLAEILVRAGSADRAQAAFASALALNPFDGRAHLGLAAILEQQGRSADAAKEYRAVLQTDPRNASALAALQRLPVSTGSP